MKRFIIFLNTIVLMLILNNSSVYAQTKSTFQNPILKGFYPDPSICRVGDDYYMVTSSFEYFPGIPIFHSKDLVNWQQIGHVLDRPSQLNLDKIHPSGGIFAPTIRYHKGTFYVITTLITNKNNTGTNFYVTAKSPAGPWSEPNWLKDAPGIDPSLFFDDDGKVYYTGNRTPDDKPTGSKYRQIWIQELDTIKKQLVGKITVAIEEGALHGAVVAESPHMYKKDGYYYIMIAEGGTGIDHAVTIFRSKNPLGPYEGNKKNPIITHRHLGKQYPVACIGHADFVETQNGEWWMILLGVRTYGGFHYNLGRETFLTPVTWQEDWPVVNAGVGKVLLEERKPNLPAFTTKKENTFDDFNSDSLQYYWNFLRTPRSKFWSLTDKKGYISLQLRAQTLVDVDHPSFVGRRQQDTSFFTETKMLFEPKAAHESAGLVVMMNNNFHFRVEKVLENQKLYLKLTRRHAGKEDIIAKQAITNGEIILGVKAMGQDYSFYFKQNNNTVLLAEKIDGRTLSRVNTGGFTGTYIGLYASSNGLISKNKAFFDWLNYQQIK
ncbi:glycoside hydrolase family 43 protein [Pedobacter glucosidilyticus]|uniref:glycoside hydrolase family 43 protein n=1 Tax=Pedobacter glucosidilyticus TaxID=1122941 RepID=UPI00040E4746|nr:glycoside hydrolase family 43 protein [Pedobacter glucosidilyticus]